MDMAHLLQLNPTLEILLEELTLRGWHCTGQIRFASQTFCGIRLFTGSQTLRRDILYVLRPGESRFPTDRFAYICTAPTEGEADHICCPEQSPEVILDALMDLFFCFQQHGSRIDQLTYQGGSLDELCELGAELLENPVYIHDDWFILIGMSRDAEAIMVPEYLMSSTKGFVPKVIVDDFKYDSDYLETYAHKDAQIWQSGSEMPNTLYVNLWDGAVYRGRLLVVQQNRSFRKSDFLLAQVLTQRAILLLQRKLLQDRSQLRSMDDTVFALLEGRAANPADLAHMLDMLNWNPADAFLCVRIRSQKTERNTVMEHQLHSDLFRQFPQSYIMFLGQEQCLILNMEQTPILPAQLRHQLALLCQDYYLYAGVSSPVSSVSQLCNAYFQAGVALEQAFRLRSDRWVLLFGDCALEYVLKNLPTPLTPGQLVSPELDTLIRYDRENGTQYFDTFREYLLNERDIPKTSASLIIHRTTLLYRLKKIQAMISLNLEDPWLRLNLMLSLKILSANPVDSQ